MKTVKLLCFASLLAAACPASGAESFKIKSPLEMARLSAQADLVHMETIDLDVHYWAWRIDKIRDITYEGLAEKSLNWGHTAAYKVMFLEKLEKALKDRPVPPLSTEENNLRMIAKDKIERLHRPARFDEELLRQLSPDYCIELKARYWALRVQNGEKDILDLMQSWGIMDAGLKERLLTRIEERVKMKNEPLTREEDYKREGCGEIIQ